MITAGRPCSSPDCPGLALYGMRFNGEVRWACRDHRHLIGFADRPAASPTRSDAGNDSGFPLQGRAAGGLQTPAASSSQGRLL